MMMMMIGNLLSVSSILSSITHSLQVFLPLSAHLTSAIGLHCPCLSPIRQHTLDTGPKYISVHVIWCTMDCQDGLLELSPPHRSSSCLVCTSTCTKRLRVWLLAHIWCFSNISVLLVIFFLFILAFDSVFVCFYSQCISDIAGHFAFCSSSAPAKNKHAPLTAAFHDQLSLEPRADRMQDFSAGFQTLRKLKKCHDEITQILARVCINTDTILKKRYKTMASSPNRWKGCKVGVLGDISVFFCSW